MTGEDDGEDWFERALRDIESEADDRTNADVDDRTDADADDTAAGADDSSDADRSGSTDADVDGVGLTGGDDIEHGPDETGVDFPSDGLGGDPAGTLDEGMDTSPFGSHEQSGGAGPDPEGGFEDVGGGGEFGFADFGGEGGDAQSFSEAEFDEEAYESDIDRIDVGIEGLDEMILGGVPDRSLITAIGSAGTGKTTFGLQFLHQALRNGEKGVYITLEESREAILSTAEEKGWPFREYEREELLAVVAIDPIEMANSLASIRNDLSRLISEFGAERLVLDSVSLLEMMYDHPAKRRSEVFEFTRSLKQAGVTTMLTSEASEENPYTSRYGTVEYLTDAVFILQYVRPSDFRETRLAVEIQKIRDANHSRETKPYEITDEGISVHQQANIF